MLAIECLSEAVSFLPLYDLDSVLLASRQVSNITTKCVKKIRIWHFGFVQVAFRAASIGLVAEGDARHVFPSNGIRATILRIALHNSRVERLGVSLRPVDVILLPIKLALEIEELELRMHGVRSANFLADAISRFRKVQVVHLYHCEKIADFSPVIDVCRKKGVRSVINKSNGADLMAE
ncbi:hypothetical protein AAVH_26104 [Aphelenchoides avenae]|nr:hypothetical protein AAVH_26104 [Aphelenchus avenae]